MELELLKKSWDRLDKRMQHIASFNEKLVENIISSRVITTIDKIKKLYASFYVLLSVEAVFLIAILLGNPFDFRYNIQYIPYALLLIGVVVAFFNLLHIHKSIRALSPDIRIDKYVKNIGSIYDRNKKFEKWFAFILFSVGLLVPFSFLPTKIDRQGVMAALTETVIAVVINLTLFIVAWKLGAFKNRYKEKLEKDLKEWKELQASASANGIESDNF